MRILQIIFSLSSGGAERLVVDLCNELAKENQVYLCVVQNDVDSNLSFFKEQVGSDVKYINLNQKKGINSKTFFNLFKLIQITKPDVIHLHLNTILYAYLPALIFRNRIKFFHTLHSVALKTIGFSWQRKLNRWYYKSKVITPIVISEENKTSFKNFYNLKDVILIENGVCAPKKTDAFKEVSMEIKKLKKSDFDTVCIHIASFAEAKNQELLIRVFNRLIREDKNLILLVIGKNFESEGGIGLQRKSAKEIYYLGTKTNISDYLLNSDIFVLTSLWEGLPMSLLEAMACGVIPVCTPAGGIPNVIKDESIGYVSKDFKEKNLYNVVKRCLGYKNTFDKSYLKRYFDNNFSIKKCAKNYQNLYNT